jgi:hypothetical protein
MLSLSPLQETPTNENWAQDPVIPSLSRRRHYDGIADTEERVSGLPMCRLCECVRLLRASNLSCARASPSKQSLTFFLFSFPLFSLRRRPLLRRRLAFV